MAPFGKYLSNRGFVARPILEEATQAMVVFGGRLGTHLVESGALTLEQLEAYLAEYLSVSTPTAEALERPDPKALAALPRHRIIELKVLPFQRDERTLHVAMRDPRDSALVTALGRETGLRIRPYLLSEVRLFFLLQQHFGVDPAGRYERKRGESDEKPRRARAPEAVPEDDARLRRRRELGIADLAADEEFIDEHTFASMLSETPPQPAAPRPPAAGPGRAHPGETAPQRTPVSDRELPPTRTPKEPPASPDALRAALERARDRWEVARHAVALARHHAAMAALFSVRDGRVERVEGPECDSAGSRATPVAVDPATLCGPTDDQGALERGAPWPDGLSDRLGRDLGRKAVRDAAVYPVTLAGRLIHLLYVDNGPEHLDSGCGPALRELCESVAKAYERIILASKKTLL